MVNINTLEKKMQDLEERLKKLEDIVIMPAYKEDQVFMEALYKKAEELVVKYKKTSVIFLQKKLMIDFERAERLLDKLRKNKVIS